MFIIISTRTYITNMCLLYTYTYTHVFVFTLPFTIKYSLKTVFSIAMILTLKITLFSGMVISEPLKWIRMNWIMSITSSLIDVTQDNASYTVTSNFDVLGRKFGYQKQRRRNAFYSVKDIFINLSACLCLCVCHCCYILFWFSGFYRYDRRDERIDGIPITVHQSLRERVFQQ